MKRKGVIRDDIIYNPNSNRVVIGSVYRDYRKYWRYDRYHTMQRHYCMYSDINIYYQKTLQKEKITKIKGVETK